MSSSRAGGGAGSAAIPANARKTVQSLKEIVPNSDDEIYAVLKECDMDPNETVQRLLNMDPFHEVKRKRDKKKEWSKEGSDSKGRPLTCGTFARRAGTVDRSSGRGGSLPRHASNDFSGGRGKSFASKENGSVNASSRVANTIGGLSLSSAASYGQGKPYISGSSSSPVPTATVAPSAGLQNGSPVFMRPAAMPQCSWVAAASGHATMADVVKANGASLPPSGLTSAFGTISVVPVSQQYIIPASVSIPGSSGVYSSLTDPVLHPSVGSRAPGTSAAIKREIGTVGNQRTKADWSSSSLTMESLSASSITSPSPQTTQTNTSSPLAVAILDTQTEVIRPNSPPVAVLPPVPQDWSASVPDTGSSVGAQTRQGTGMPPSGLPGPRTPVGNSFSSRPVYLSQQHPVGTQRATGAGLEWKPKLVVKSSVSMGAVNMSSPLEAVRPSSPSVSGDSGILTAATSKLHGVTIHDDQPVIIPNHLQVPGAEQTHLSFGSFAAGFGASFSTSYNSEESDKAPISIAESTPVIETPVEEPSALSKVNTTPAGLNQSYVHQSISAPEEMLVVSRETSAASLPPPAALQSNLPKPDPVAHQGPLYPYLPAVPNYPGFNLVQQVPVGQYAYEASEAQPPDVPRMPSLVQPYTDHAASYYTPLFRPGSDGDGRYPFVASNTSNKYNGSIGLVNLAGQNLTSPESGNPVLPPVPAAQTSQTGNGQTVPTLPQQHLPLHAYPGQPGGAHLGHHFANVFGYQFIPPSYAYMHSHPPFQHNYTTNSVYPQGPTGNSYPTAAANTYPPGGATAVKYQLPQYKPGNTTGIAPHSGAAAGYSGYSSAPSGYAVNPTVTVGSTTGYDDVGVQQYKDNLYIPSPQVEGSTVWIPAQLSRDGAVGGMQANSYYNMPGQGQHGAYAHAQQPTHAHPHPGAYASLYHPSQSVQAPTAHQLLQQPPSLGGGGASQAGGYQQPQRTQQTWTNNY